MEAHLGSQLLPSALLASFFEAVGWCVRHVRLIRHADHCYIRISCSVFGEAILISEMPGLQNIARDANLSVLG